MTSLTSLILPKKIKPPTISARCWAIMDAQTGNLIFGRKETKKREIASLTKMMNLLCVLKLVEEYNIDPKNTYLEVSKLAASMKGTTANLRTGDVLTVWDLLHGLMLPSGNDAAWALAEGFGRFIYLRSDEYKAKCIDSKSKASSCKNPLKYFLKMMNQTAQDLEMFHTQYANPHGLVNPFNVSTAADQAKLSHHLLKWEMAREVVNTQVYSCEIEMTGERVRKATWENTNKLLGKEGWGGVKTGITTAAGYCLSSYYKKGQEAFIVILLCSASKEIRWVEAPQLVQWAREIRDQEN